MTTLAQALATISEVEWRDVKYGQAGGIASFLQRATGEVIEREAAVTIREQDVSEREAKADAREQELAEREAALFAVAGLQKTLAPATPIVPMQKPGWFRRAA